MYVYNQNEFYMATCINCDKTETAMDKNSILKAKYGLLFLYIMWQIARIGMKNTGLAPTVCWL